MDPFTIALAVFGVQKLRGQSTSRSFRDALMAATATYGVGQMGTLLQGSEAVNAASLTDYGAGAANAGITAAAPTASQVAATNAFNTAGTAATNVGGIGAYTVPNAAAYGTEFTSGFPAVTNVGSGIVNAAPTTITPQGLESTTITPPESSNFVKKLSESYEGVKAEGSKAIETIKGLGKDAWQEFKAADPATKLGLGITASSLASSYLTPKPKNKKGWTEEDYKAAYERQPDLNLDLAERPAYISSREVYNYNSPLYGFNKGGIVDALPKYAVGGINYLPSKVSHDENDINNYVRATGYVEDGSGTGDKDTDTILAQLADGEFVSRTDAVLGAGIMAGASPMNIKEMRQKGAAYFYEQQARFKRIFDLLDASRKYN